MTNTSLFIVIVILLIFYYRNNSIDLERIKQITKQISIYRPVQSDNLKMVKTYVKSQLQLIDNYTVTEQKFTRNINETKYEFSNIIATPVCCNTKHSPKIILGAHIDAPQINGIEATIDACTSIAIIIEIVTKLVLNNNSQLIPIQIVFFDGEEAIDGPWSRHNTLSGSRYFVSTLKEKPEQVIICDLIGGDINKNKIYAFASNQNSIQVIKELSEYNSDIFVHSKTVSYKKITADHTPFIEANIQATILIPDIFPATHHKLSDNYTNVNWEYVDIFANALYRYLKDKIK